MNPSQYSSLFSFLFNIANDVLVQAFEKGDYKKIILPFIVLRRLDLLLEPTKEAALQFSRSEEFAMMPEESREQQLCLITGYPFYNTSSFTMNLLRAVADRMRNRRYSIYDGAGGTGGIEAFMQMRCSPTLRMRS